MKSFILNTLFFLIFGFIVYYGLHRYALSLPNDYKLKNELVEEKSSSIKILNLGNSQSLYAINPEYFTKEGFNLANVSQTLDIDYLLFHRHINRLDSLEYLILQVSYTSFFEILGYSPEAWRTKNYARFYHITPLFDQSKQFNSLVITERNNLLKLYEYVKGENLIYCNQYGFDESFTSENSQSEIAESAQKKADWHKAESYELAVITVGYLKKTIQLARSKNINVIVYVPPIHDSYRQLLNDIQLKLMYQCIGDILNESNDLIFLDWSQNEIFVDEDFYDADHLNDRGAKKLTLLLDSVLEAG